MRYKFLIVLSDAPDINNYIRGEALYYFLSSFISAPDLGICRMSQLKNKEQFTTDILLIGLPSSLSHEDINCIKFSNAVLFDYFDEHEPKWTNENKKFLQSIGAMYLKTSLTVQCDHSEIRFGLLPVHIKSRISSIYDWSVCRRMAVDRFPSLRWNDICFAGAVTYLTNYQERYNQRIEWLREIHDTNIRFSGGLLELPYYTKADCLQEFGQSIEPLFLRRRISYRRLFYTMLHSKISLCPTGHVRWTYRHIESAFAGNLIISTDVRQIRTLIPLPHDLMLIVPDHESVVPYIDQVLQRWSFYYEMACETHKYFDQFFYKARYSLKRRKPFELFISQFVSG